MHVGFVGRDRVRLVLPGHRWVGHDDLQVREVGGDVVQQQRVGVLQFDAAPAGQAGAHTVLSGVGNDRQPQLLEPLPERVVLAVRGVEPLHGRVEFEAAHSELLGLAGGLGQRVRPGAGIHGAEWDEDVVVPGAAGHEVIDGVRLVAELGARVHGEDDGGHPALPVGLRDGVHARGPFRGLEVLRGGFEEVFRQRFVAARVHFEVDVHVHGLDGRGVHAQLVADWGGAGSRG